MVKRVSVVLNQSVSKLGNNGDLVDVAPGYARNYLLPQGLASIATKGIIQQVEARREKERQLKLAEKQAAENKKVAFKTIGKLTIRKQVGEENAIFGTVTTQDIAEIIKQQAGIEVDRRGIEVPEVKTTGDYQAEVKLHPEVSASVDFQVIPL
ncbi:MAG: 50S ribosomal protein L9 [Cyanobacteria bacterium J06621_8]